MRRSFFASWIAIAVIAWSALTASAATRWRVMGASLTLTPRSALSELAETGEGTLHLAPGESAIFFARGAETNDMAALLFLAAPSDPPTSAELTLKDNGDLIVVQAGRAVFYSRTPEDHQSIRVDMPPSGQAAAFRPRMPAGRLVVYAIGGETHFSFEPAPGMPTTWPAEAPVPPNAWLLLLPDGRVAVVSRSLPGEIVADLARVPEQISLAAARQEQGALQQQLVLNLTRIEPSLEERPPEAFEQRLEVRTTVETAQGLITAPLYQAPSTYGLVTVAPTYSTVRNPGAISPASISAGPNSRGLPPANLFYGQGLGTGGLAILGVRSYNPAATVVTFGPGALISPGVRP